MEHLTANEIISFVSLTENNEESIALCAYINGHIRKCEECRKTVNAFQFVYEEFCKMGNCNSFEEYLEKSGYGNESEK